MAAGDPVPGSLFIYAPNQGAPVFFAVAFAISAVGHFWQCSRYKCFSLLGLHPVCATLFTAGYALREYASFNYLYSPQNLIFYIVSQVLIFICPPLLELANYHVLGRVFYYVPHRAPLPPGRVLATFGGLMALVEALNAIGVALAANPTSSQPQQSLGKHLTVAALAIQVAVIIIFVILAGMFHRRCAQAKIRAKPVSTTLLTLYASMTLIFIRCVFRLVEHSGNTSVRLKDIDSLRSLTPLLRYEWFFYVFEATLMLLNSVLWNVWNPGRYLRRGVYLSRDGTSELQGGKDLDERSLGQKIGSVVTFGLLFRNKKQSKAFEELRDLSSADNQGPS
ncbi:hypothetical protein B0T16DRAFT_513063 [Cercophora newfieldiana]|uniref:RTA1 domain protein n=1 Tax=Cercophora newfieldiana TaxID=92897 RepID=A0AA39Y0K0_9PEZI|nr:hypothetical protein B0T16DRAFT_513063 [Cercophora newfieldiana]